MRLLTLLLLIMTVSCSKAKPEKDLRQSNLQLTSRYFNEVYNENRIDLIDSLFVEDYEHTSTEGRKFNSREELKSAVKRIESLLPNLKLQIVEAVPDEEKVMFLIRMESDLPKMSSSFTKATKTNFNETFIFWVKEGKIYKGRSIGAHLPFIKQVSGFEGGLLDVIKTLSMQNDSIK
ncbi:nuclear transport factor 2 family protein [Hanstruepera marina]|uniref:nuclear transport factor 2 family protein n=1 Tax=Hanstruepera marina TaxID=2873265 RepID=UPI001CA78B52|nr:nuclear transport factor 2 family protein [Hanstruepera marina]